MFSRVAGSKQKSLGPQILSFNDMGFHSECYEYVLWPLIDKETVLAYRRENKGRLEEIERE